MIQHGCVCAALLLAGLAAGCRSPYHADRGALFGGLTGAGVGALVGHAAGNPLAGAAIGAGVGTVTGAAVGSSLDEIEARNRAEIAARLGRPVGPGAVTLQDVVAMTRAGVSEDVIMTHVRHNGVAQSLATADIIYLQNNGVSPRVIQVMQLPPARSEQVVYVEPPPPAVVVAPAPYYWGPPPPPWRYRRYSPWPPPRPRGGVSWGMSISSP